MDGFAEIVEAWHRNRSGAAGNCKMKLLLDVPGIEPQVVKYHEAAMTYNRWPEVGMRVAVTVDADHPDRAEVHWESVFGKVRGGLLGVLAEEAASTVGADIDLSTGPPGETSRTKPAEDYKERVDELNAQYRAGQITYEEMAEHLQRVLGG